MSRNILPSIWQVVKLHESSKFKYREFATEEIRIFTQKNEKYYFFHIFSFGQQKPVLTFCYYTSFGPIIKIK